MGATLIHRSKETRADGVTIEMVIWSVDPAVAGSAHEYKYRLYAGRAGRTLVRYDNEAGKGDHKHVGADEAEVPFRFVSMQQAVSDFLADVARLTGE
ncbi:hypothetical protein E6C76_10010 [Pseudothauera nasutitermitis]|uniref:Uncharacterized protein n=2 Tax=Pseudothauera nasutitermitis TaxID=2565930 RepID=A0A4V3WC68_9RHOO|nr:hypothetical protein E6C76_10010 [Pseudothauera nasutitermitis]